MNGANDLIEKLLNALDSDLAHGYCRWQDEKDYEDINDYAVLYAAKAKQLGWEITKMISRPYGFLAVNAIARIELRVKVTARAIRWTALPV